MIDLGLIRVSVWTCSNETNQTGCKKQNIADFPLFYGSPECLTVALVPILQVEDVWLLYW